MKDRMAGLEELVVMPGFLDSGLGGRKIVDGDGGMWVGLRVEGNRVGHWAEVRSCRSSAAATTRGSWVATAAAAAGGAGYGGSRAAEDRASMMLPFMLDLSPEDGPCL